MKSNFTIFQISYIKRNLTNLIVILICLVCFTKSQEGEESSLNIKLNPPEENPKETIGKLLNFNIEIYSCNQ